MRQGYGYEQPMMRPPPPRAPQPPQPQMSPHYAETVFVNTTTPQATSLTRLTVPLVMMGTICIFLISVTALATSQFGEIKYAIDGLSRQLDAINTSLSDRISRIEQDAVSRSREQWTKTDHDLWCAKAEQINSNSGWRCGESGGTWGQRAEPQQLHRPRADTSDWSTTVK